MNAAAIYDLLQEACKALEEAGDHGIAAQVSYAMFLVNEKYEVGVDHLSDGDEPQLDA